MSILPIHAAVRCVIVGKTGSVTPVRISRTATGLLKILTTET